METLFDPEQRKRVEAAIRAAEARSRGEIVLAVAPRSADYARWLALPVLIATVAVAAGAHLLWPRLPAPWIFAGELPLAALLTAVARLRPVTRWLVPDGAEVAAVRREALRLFSEKAIFETEGRTGVLFYLSVLERRVEILPDRGLDAHVDAATWAQHAARLAEALRKGEAAEALCAVVTGLGARLEARLGPDPAGKNELPDLA
jgi:putative membrane protein